MRRKTTLAAVALALLAAGCGQQQPTQREALASYLKHVNKIESALTRPLASVTSAGNQFAQEQARGGTLTNLVTASHRQALIGAWSQIVALRARLAAVKAPPAAARLRGLLLQIIDGQAALTREVAQLVDFLPSFSAALRPLAPATRQLELALAQQSSSRVAGVSAAYAGKAAALQQCKHAVDAVGLGDCRVRGAGAGDRGRGRDQQLAPGCLPKVEGALPQVDRRAGLEVGRGDGGAQRRALGSPA